MMLFAHQWWECRRKAQLTDAFSMKTALSRSSLQAKVYLSSAEGQRLPPCNRCSENRGSVNDGAQVAIASERIDHAGFRGLHGRNYPISAAPTNCSASCCTIYCVFKLARLRLVTSSRSAAQRALIAFPSAKPRNRKRPTNHGRTMAAPERTEGIQDRASDGHLSGA
jgi:hypothetical protein